MITLLTTFAFIFGLVVGATLSRLPWHRRSPAPAPAPALEPLLEVKTERFGDATPIFKYGDRRVARIGATCWVDVDTQAHLSWSSMEKAYDRLTALQKLAKIRQKLDEHECQQKPLPADSRFADAPNNYRDPAEVE